jgi:hypothetical protein
VERSTREGELQYEEVARKASLLFKARTSEWFVDEESLHTTSFVYDIFARDEGDDLEEADNEAPSKCIGSVTGYVIGHDWTAGPLELWDEADAIDGDACRYVESLIHETRACAAVFGTGVDLSMSQRILIIRHVDAAAGVDSVDLLVKVVACIALKETPMLLLVDPREMPDQREHASGQLQGRTHTKALMSLGLVRMVSSDFVWGWSVSLAEVTMDGYCYTDLLAAMRAGELEAILKRPVDHEFYERFVPPEG